MNENKHNIEKSKTDKSRCFQCPSPFGRRLTVMVTGLFALGFGISILRSINMGLDPCSCLTQGVSNLTHLSFGTCQVLCNFLMFLVVLKFDISRLGWGTVGNMVFLGYISDFFIWLYKVLLPVDFFNSLVVRWFFLIPGLVCLLFGAAAYMCSGLGSSPSDAVPFIISAHVKKSSFRTIRILWDISFLVIGFVLGVMPGIVTVATAFFCGPVVAWMQKKLESTIFANR